MRRHSLLLWAAAAIVACAVVVRLVLDPVATRFTHRALEKSGPVQGTFSSVHISVFPLGYEITNIKIIERPDGRWDEPFFYADRVHVGLHWGELLRLRVVADVDLEGPKMIFARDHKEKAKKAPAMGQALEDNLPLRVDRIDISDGEVLVADGPSHGRSIWIHDLSLHAANLATRKALMESEPARLRIAARVQRSGRLSVEAEMDPWAKGLTFSVHGALRDLKAAELYSFLAPKTGVAATEGTIDAFVGVRAKGGVLSGGVKPVLKNIKVESAGDGFGDRLKAALVDTAFSVLSDEVPGRHAVATVIPIRGTISGPDVQSLPAVLGVVRNAFVIALSSGFANLPPAVAPEHEGAIKQIGKALKKDAGPPKAQPVSSAHAGT